MPLRERLYRGRRGILAALGGGDPITVECREPGLPFGLPLGSERTPPAITLRVGVGSPTLRDFFAVFGVVEPGKHVLCHEIFSFTVLSGISTRAAMERINRALHGADLRVHACSLASEELEVMGQDARLPEFRAITRHTA